MSEGSTLNEPSNDIEWFDKYGRHKDAGWGRAKSQFVGSKAALLFFTTLSLFVICGSLCGCNEKTVEAVNEGVKKFDHGLMTDDRAAIQAVVQKVNQATNKYTSGSRSIHDVKEADHQAYEILLLTDISSCPSDFRNQYQKLISSMRVLNAIEDDIPEEDPGSVSNPKELGHRLQAQLEDVVYQMKELKAIAHKYDADQDFH